MIYRWSSGWPNCRALSGKNSVKQWIRELKKAAMNIENELRGPGGAQQLEDYRAWYRHDAPM